VTDLLARLGLEQSICAVEVNRALVPKRLHGETQLRQDDRIEVVTLVGGG
jgi:thiamine biosynthesis protein ThiS